MAKKDGGTDNLFQRLTALFRSGPIVKRKVRAYKDKGTPSSAHDVFKKNLSSVYSTAMSSYGQYDRMSRYSDFSEMEYTPEIATALDILSEEVSAQDDKGRVLHIFSENSQIQRLLEELFYDTLNVEFNLTPWVRDMCKYGDLFAFLDVSPEYGIQNILPIPINEIAREEGYDPADPLAVRFRWVTQGNKVLENWQIAHFRLLGNDAFLPYGSSILEPARRIWRQLILIEDAMLVYRVVRSPERRVFYIDVGAVPAEDIPNYMEQAKTILKGNKVIDSHSGRVDLRYNPLSVDEDYFIPTRGGEGGSKIDTLAGGVNVTATEDVEYIQRKLFSALKIPKAYLGFDESLSSKAGLAQEDIRFSRTVNRIQRVVLSELNKIAVIHLYSNGFEGDDLLDFTLQLSNPSTIAQQQKLEIYRTRLEIAGSAPEAMVDRHWIRKNILNLTDDEIERIEIGRVEDKVADLKIEGITGEPVEAGGGGGGGGGGAGGGMGGEPAGGEEIPDEAPAGEEAGGAPGGEPDEGGEEDEDAPLPSTEDLFSGKERSGQLIDEDDDDIDLSMLSVTDDEAPVRAEAQMSNQLKRVKKNREQLRHHGPGKTHMPDFARMVNHKRPGDTLTDPYDTHRVLQTDPFKESQERDSEVSNFLDRGQRKHAKMTMQLSSTLKSLDKSIGRSKSNNDILTESQSLLDIYEDDDVDNITSGEESGDVGSKA